MNVLIIGATSGIGLDFLRRIEGNSDLNITIASRSAKDSEMKSRHQKVYIDLCNHSTFANIDESFDVVVIASGIVHNMLIGMIRNEKLEAMLNTNLVGQIMFINHLIANKLINRGARVTFLSSIAANYSMKGNSIYSVSKAGLEAFVRGCANEFQRKKILVNSIAPGMVNTKMTLDAKKNLGDSAIIIDEKKYPLGYANTDDIVDFLEYLSFSNNYINGQNIVIDGGRTITI